MLSFHYASRGRENGLLTTAVIAVNRALEDGSWPQLVSWLPHGEVFVVLAAVADGAAGEPKAKVRPHSVESRFPIEKSGLVRLSVVEAQDLAARTFVGGLVALADELGVVDVSLTYGDVRSEIVRRWPPWAWFGGPIAYNADLTHRDRPYLEAMGAMGDRVRSDAQRKMQAWFRPEENGELEMTFELVPGGPGRRPSTRATAWGVSYFRAVPGGVTSGPGPPAVLDLVAGHLIEAMTAIEKSSAKPVGPRPDLLTLRGWVGTV